MKIFFNSGRPWAGAVEKYLYFRGMILNIIYYIRYLIVRQYIFFIVRQIYILFFQIFTTMKLAVNIAKMLVSYMGIYLSGHYAAMP